MLVPSSQQRDDHLTHDRTHARPWTYTSSSTACIIDDRPRRDATEVAVKSHRRPSRRIDIARHILVI